MNKFKKLLSLNHIIHALYWRAPLYRDMAIAVWAFICIKFRWLVKRTPRKHALSAKLIVSLTSYPPRFGTLALTLQCLLTQTIKADHTILWVSNSDFNALPKEVLALQSSGLEIRTALDTKSYKKILPTLDTFPSAFICTADDDVYYPSSWLEELAEQVSVFPLIVSCHRANRMQMDLDGNFEPYSKWPLSEPSSEISTRLFPTGVGGVLYPPGSLNHTSEDRTKCLELCPQADDVWLYWVGRRNGTSYRMTKSGFLVINWIGSQKVALWRTNVDNHGNDAQIRNMLRNYGHPINH